MVIDFRNAVEMEIYPIQADIIFDDDILDGYYLAELSGIPRLDGRYVLTDDKLTVDFTVSADVVFRCDRCLEPVEKHFDVKVAEMFMPADEAEEAYEFVYDKNIIDISELIRERFLLALPMSVLCRDDCKGLCPQCGSNLNKGKCECIIETREEACESNPFAKLKDFNMNAGGANNGSTKG